VSSGTRFISYDPYATGLQSSNSKHEKSTNHQTNYSCAYISSGSRDSAVGIATRLGAGRPRDRSSSPDKVMISLFSTSFWGTPNLLHNVPRDSDPRMTAMPKASTLYKKHTRPLVREDVMKDYDRWCSIEKKIWP
jgi:hypothetical protein